MEDDRRTPDVRLCPHMCTYTNARTHTIHTLYTHIFFF